MTWQWWPRRDPLGTWGWIEAYRDRGERPFAGDDLDVFRRVSRTLGRALRVRAMQPWESVSEPRPPGVIVLDSNLRPVSWTAAAKAWIHAMPAGEMYEAMGMLPAAVYPAVEVARSRPSAPARVLSQASDGEWMALEVALLGGAQDRGLVVAIRAATAEETFGLLCRAYGLTPRERQLVALIMEGRDTRGISQQLGISRYTVQEHATSVFEKTGVAVADSSWRCWLVGRRRSRCEQLPERIARDPSRPASRLPASAARRPTRARRPAPCSRPTASGTK